MDQTNQKKSMSQSRSKSQNSDSQGAQGEGEHYQHVDSEGSGEEELQEDNPNVEDNVGAESKGNNTRPRRANTGTGVTRLVPSMRGKSYQDNKVQFAQKGMTNVNHKCE